jgi:hypothetical protein
MAAIDAQGTIFSFADGVPAPQIVGGIQSFNISSTADERDVTNLASTAKEYKIGLQDNGTLQLSVLYDPADVGQAAMISARAANAIREVVMTLSGGQIATFNTLVKALPIDGAADDDLKSTIDLRITGAIVWS